MSKKLKKTKKRKYPIIRRIVFFMFIICWFLYFYFDVKELGLITPILMILVGVPSWIVEQKKLKKNGSDEDIALQKMSMLSEITCALVGIAWSVVEVVLLIGNIIYAYK